MSRIINLLYFLSICLILKFFCLVILVILMPAKFFFGFTIFSASFSSKYFFFIYFISCSTSFLALLYISQSMLRRLDLNFLNNLSLKLNFSTISLSNHSLLVFFFFYSHSFQGCNFIYCFNKLMKKVVIYLVYITIFFIVSKYHMIQSLFILLH